MHLLLNPTHPAFPTGKVPSNPCLPSQPLQAVDNSFLYTLGPLPRTQDPKGTGPSSSSPMNSVYLANRCACHCAAWALCHVKGFVTMDMGENWVSAALTSLFCLKVSDSTPHPCVPQASEKQCGCASDSADNVS